MERPSIFRRIAGALRILFVLLVALPVAASAQEEGLYDPEPPADAAFVRLVQARSDADPLVLALGEADFGAVDYRQVTPYRVVSEGDYQLPGEVPFTVEAGRFYTIASTRTGMVVLEDPAGSDRAKALIVFYNLSDRPALDLQTADGSVTVVEGMGPDEAGSVQVNPIAIDFGVFEGDTRLALIEDPGLLRGAAYGIFAFGGADDLQVGVVAAETRTD